MNKLLSQVEFLKSRFGEEVAINPRIVWMCWTILYLVLLYVGLATMDAKHRLEAKVFGLENERLKLESVGTLAVWNERIDSQQQIQQSIGASCGVAKEPQLSSADLQTTIQGIVNTYDIENSRLNLTEALALGKSDTFWRHRAQITGRMPRDQVLPMLVALESRSSHVAVERLVATFSDRGVVVDLLLSVCFMRKEDG